MDRVLIELDATVEEEEGQVAGLDRAGDSIAAYPYSDWACNRGIQEVKGTDKSQQFWRL